jgi:CBS domain-containing protein
MAQKVREVMTRELLMVDINDTLAQAARQMRDADVGALIVTHSGDVRGVVTDRDITVRGVAEDLDPQTARLAEIVTHDLVATSPDDDVDTAVELMRTHAVRRLPVMDGEQPVGIVSLGDLAVERDSGSVLAQISTEEPNN